MTEDHGKWNFTDDEERRLAIEAEASAQATIAEATAQAASKWWLVAIVVVTVLGGVQVIGMVTGVHAPSLFTLAIGKDK